MTIHDAHENVIDPYYDTRTYAIDFDYDLLGRPIAWDPLLSAVQLSCIRGFCERYSWSISGCILGLAILIPLLLETLKKLPWIFLQLCAQWMVRKELKREQRIWEQRKRFMQPEDHDRYAAVYCRLVSSQLGVTDWRHPIPRDLIDYEAVRFVFQQPWLIEKTHKALQTASVDPSVEQLVEGELEDALKLAEKQRRLAKRKQLSIPGKIRARHMLAKGEDKSQTGSEMSAEMLLLQGWMELYKARVQWARKENYAWWLSQGRTLPVEAYEAVQRLRPLVGKDKKVKAGFGDQLVEIGEDLVQAFTRLPHQEIIEGISSKRKTGAKRSTPTIEISPPEYHRTERLLSQQQESNEAMMLREILGMEHLHRVRLRRPRRHSSVYQRSRRKTKTRESSIFRRPTGY